MSHKWGISHGYHWSWIQTRRGNLTVSIYVSLVQSELAQGFFLSGHWKYWICQNIQKVLFTSASSSKSIWTSQAVSISRDFKMSNNTLFKAPVSLKCAKFKSAAAATSKTSNILRATARSHSSQTHEDANSMHTEDGTWFLVASLRVNK